MDKNEIKKILESVDKEKFSHVLICVDKWDYHYFVKYVKRQEDIDEFIEKFFKEHKGGMFGIQEVYNLDLDIDMQLSEFRSNHREKSNKSTIVNKNSKNEMISERALKYATKKHEGQYRKDKQHKEYICHPIGVANLVKIYKGNSDNIDELLAAAYLHDTLEDTNTTYDELVNEFGQKVASIVLELSNDDVLKNKIGKSKYLAVKMNNMTNDALDIKLCDRLNNISGLAITDNQFRDKYINETLYIIKYLMDNRNLTNDQLNIIQSILVVLNWLIASLYDDDSKESHDILSLTTKYEEK